MTEHDLKVLGAMRAYGGSFTKALAQAAGLADPVSFARIKAAFPEAWRYYGTVAEGTTKRMRAVTPEDLEAHGSDR